MNVLSLFDGISCGMLALQRAGGKVDKYYASEIDKHATAISNKNWPNIIRLGDINNWHTWGIDWHKIDLVIAGSPCQGFSFAGKQLAFDDPRSKLFFTFVDILEEIKVWNPKVKFLLENVRMKKEYLDVITKYMGVKPIFLDSNLLSAQNRKRYYWTNLKSVKVPKDRGFLLKDVIETEGLGVIKNRNVWQDRESKSMCIDHNYYKGVDNHGQRTQILEFYLNDQEIKRAKEKYRAKIWPSGNRMGNMVFPDNILKKSKALCSTRIKGARETIHVKDNFGVRMLTPVECERLQTLPDNYTEGVSNTQRYKTLGNAWTVDIIAHIFKSL